MWGTRGLELTVKVYLTACVHAQLECLKYLTEAKNTWVDEAARYCARTGNFEVIKYAMGVYPYDLSEEAQAPTVFNQVAEAGHLECLKRMYAVPEWVTPDSAQAVMDGAAVKGHLPIIEFAMTQPQRKNLMVILAVAAEYGHLHIVEYFCKQDCELHEVHIESAALGGHLHIIKYLHELHCPSSPSVAAVLAKGNYLEALQYVHSQGMGWDEDACQMAATAGSIECLMYLHQQGCVWRDVTHPESAEWLLHTHDTLPEGEEFKLIMPEPEVITVSAARAPTSACLEYVVSQGATLVPSCGKVVLNSRSVSSIRFLHARGYRWGEEACIAVVKCKWPEGLKCLHELGVPWSDATTTAASTVDCIELMEYAVEHGCDYTDGTLYWMFEEHCDDCFEIVKRKHPKRFKAMIKRIEYMCQP